MRPGRVERWGSADLPLDQMQWRCSRSAPREKFSETVAGFRRKRSGGVFRGLHHRPGGYDRGRGAATRYPAADS